MFPRVVRGQIPTNQFYERNGHLLLMQRDAPEMKQSKQVQRATWLQYRYTLSDLSFGSGISPGEAILVTPFRPMRIMRGWEVTES